MDFGELFAAVDLLQKEKGIPKAYMLDKISQALVTAYKQGSESDAENIEVVIDEVGRSVRMYVSRQVVENVENPDTEISLAAARELDPKYAVGDVVPQEFNADRFVRRAAQTARQVIIQGIREAERGMIYDEFTSKEHELMSGLVTRVDPRTGNASVRVGSGTEMTEALLAVGEQIKGEPITEGMRIRAYVVEVRRSTRGAQVLLSRTHPGLVKRLFELEVPELYEGVVEMRSIAREAGSRTKIAVWSTDENVDAVGACVGPKGGRVGAVVSELRGEKVDIIKYSEDPAQFIASALSPADVVGVSLAPEGKSCQVLVPDDQLSLAIGKEGQNARLAAKLTGYKIDIKAESEGYTVA